MEEEGNRHACPICGMPMIKCKKTNKYVCYQCQCFTCKHFDDCWVKPIVVL